MMLHKFHVTDVFFLFFRTCRQLPDLDEAQTFKHHEGT